MRASWGDMKGFTYCSNCWRQYNAAAREEAKNMANANAEADTLATVLENAHAEGPTAS